MIPLKDLIKSRRLEIGKTLEQVGKEVGVSKATVQRWESGQIKDIRRGKLVELARALDATTGYLMGQGQEPRDSQEQPSQAQGPEAGQLAAPPQEAPHPTQDDEDIRFIARKMKTLPQEDKEMLMRMIRAAFADEDDRK